MIQFLVLTCFALPVLGIIYNNMLVLLPHSRELWLARILNDEPEKVEGTESKFYQNLKK